MTQCDHRLEDCGTPPRGEAAARRAILDRTAVFLATHAAETCVWVAIWQSAGQASRAGQLDADWLWRWALLLASIVPLRFWSRFSQGRLASGVGGLQLRGLPLSGALSSLVSVVELALASAVLAMGESGGMLLGVFLAWALLAIVAAWRYARARDAVRDDYALNPHQVISARMGRWAVRLNSFGTNGWLVIGVLGLAPAFSGGASPTTLVIGLGGALLVYQALRGALNGVSELIAAVVVWSETTTLDSVEESREMAIRYRLDGPAMLKSVRDAAVL